MAEAVTRVDEFFSEYLGCNLETIAPRDVKVVASPRREQTELLYADVFALWMLVFQKRAAVSVQPRLAGPVTRLVARYGVNGIRSGEFLTEAIGLITGDSHTCAGVSSAAGPILFTCPDLFRPRFQHSCRRITPGDVPALQASGLHGNWLEQSVQEGTCFAGFDADRPVAVCGTFPVPHMADAIADIGLAGTLESHRRLGYGKTVLSATTQAVIEQNKVPVYMTSDRNAASAGTAHAVGYREYGWDFRVRIRAAED